VSKVNSESEQARESNPRYVGQSITSLRKDRLRVETQGLDGCTFQGR